MAHGKPHLSSAGALAKIRGYSGYGGGQGALLSTGTQHSAVGLTQGLRHHGHMGSHLGHVGHRNEPYIAHGAPKVNSWSANEDAKI